MKRAKKKKPAVKPIVKPITSECADCGGTGEVQMACFACNALLTEKNVESGTVFLRARAVVVDGVSGQFA
jgi:hypothetical protein